MSTKNKHIQMDDERENYPDPEGPPKGNITQQLLTDN